LFDCSEFTLKFISFRFIYLLINIWYVAICYLIVLTFYDLARVFLPVAELWFLGTGAPLLHIQKSVLVL